eukprot:m51a1_g2945 putative xylosidase glycosyl hydrolase (1135) ;mRNA; f:612040-619154
MWWRLGSVVGAAAAASAVLLWRWRRGARAAPARAAERVALPRQRLVRAPRGLTEAACAEALSAAVRHETVAGAAHPEVFRDLHADLAARFPLVHERLGVEKVGEDRQSLLFTWNGTNKDLEPVLLLAHLDVAPAEAPGWERPPFSGHVDRDPTAPASSPRERDPLCLWGRGSLGGKAALVGVLGALEALLDAGYVPSRTLLLACGHDAELGGLRGARKLAERVAPAHPRLHAVLDVGGALVETPGWLAPRVGAMAALVGVAEKGRADLKMLARGDAGGHASVPPSGATAVAALVAAIGRVVALKTKSTLRFVVPLLSAFRVPAVLRALFWVLALVCPGALLRALRASSPAVAAMTRTTLAVTRVSAGTARDSVPLTATASVDVRVMPGETLQQARELVEKAASDPRVLVSCDEDSSHEPSEATPAEGPVWDAISWAVHEVFGTDVVVAPYLVPEGTDSKHFRGFTKQTFRFAPVVVARGLVGAQHGANERIRLDSLHQLVDWYTVFVQQLWLVKKVHCLLNLGILQHCQLVQVWPYFLKPEPGSKQYHLIYNLKEFNWALPCNPVLWEDLADLDIIRVGNAYYYSASTMHFSPGAPVLRSYDLVNWEYIGHSVPKLDWNAKYDLTNNQRGYVAGIWASFFNYNKAHGKYYWGGCSDGKTHIFSSANAAGPWTHHADLPCYYDCGMHAEDDGTMYVAYGNTEIHVAQLSADGKTQVRDQKVFTGSFYIEGSRMYKHGSDYIIFVTRPANGQYVLRSTSGPWGPYTIKELLLNLPGPVTGGGVPHQGGLVDTPDGKWYYMAFVDSYPGGRIPALAPITWGSDGFPVLQKVNNAWGKTYDLPLPTKAVKPHTGTDSFTGTALGAEWEWNHNPDTTKFSVNNGLTLQTATVTNDIYQARNTITHRILGPTSMASVLLAVDKMKDGDRAGLSVFRHKSASVGVKKVGGKYFVCMVNGIDMVDKTWATQSTGTEVQCTSITATKIWLRATADINPGSGRKASFSYSTDGNNYIAIGNSLTLNNDWPFFMGYRWAIYNFATTSLGGSVTVKKFTICPTTGTCTTTADPDTTESSTKSQPHAQSSSAKSLPHTQSSAKSSHGESKTKPGHSSAAEDSDLIATAATTLPSLCALVMAAYALLH